MQKSDESFIGIWLRTNLPSLRISSAILKKNCLSREGTKANLQFCKVVSASQMLLTQLVLHLYIGKHLHNQLRKMGWTLSKSVLVLVPWPRELLESFLVSFFKKFIFHNPAGQMTLGSEKEYFFLINHHFLRQGHHFQDQWHSFQDQVHDQSMVCTV